ncbi:MAG: nickel pincer cofactor biosynthesis protein LarB [bacterium]|nr:nickel pincer cofactor biosynthesis protein LarB [bacterium]
MHTESLKIILNQVQSGKLSIEKALEKLRTLPYEDLGFAKLDHHRHLRQGFPEVIFCQGKTIDQLLKIIARFVASKQNVLGTRASQEVGKAVKKKFPKANYNELARTIVITQKPIKPTGGKIVVVCAGTADIPVAEEAVVTAEVLGNNVERVYDVGVAGLHRLLDKRETLFSANVIIVIAGMEGALASVVGGLVNCPVVAVPTSIGYGASFGGLAALLAMLNSCASNVAVMNIDNGFGAGCFASLINQTRR